MVRHVRQFIVSGVWVDAWPTTRLWSLGTRSGFRLGRRGVSDYGRPDSISVQLDMRCPWACHESSARAG